MGWPLHAPAWSYSPSNEPVVMSESAPATSIASHVGAAVGDCAATAPSTTAIRRGLAPEAAPILCRIFVLAGRRFGCDAAALTATARENIRGGVRRGSGGSSARSR